MPHKNMIPVLVVDSTDERREETVEQLKEHDRLTVHGAATVVKAKEVIDTIGVECIVSERRLDDGIAMDIFRYAADEKSEIGRIIMTAGDEVSVLLQSIDLIYGYVDRREVGAYQRLADLIIDGYDHNAFAPYPVPEDEPDRLDVLEKYRDKTDDFLNTLVDQAAEEFDVEKVSVRFINRETQEYVACHGFLPPDIERGQTICTYNIMDDDVMVVEDVQDDPRFEDNELLRAMDIRWYAGAVIKLEGQNIGTFCLEDSEQKEFTDEDRERLKNYAARAATTLALQQAFKSKKTNTLEDAVEQALEKSTTALS